MRLVFAGTPQVALPSLAMLADGPHEVVAVLTRPDAPAGRGRSRSRSAVAQWADDRGIPVLQPERVSDPAAQRALADLAPDCCPVVAYGALVPPAALVIPPQGWVNLHFSLLPAWRGAAPVQRALMAGDEVTGATTFALEPGLDTGPVYGVLTERVRPTDTAGDLLTRLADAGAQLLAATLDGIADGSLHPQPQPADGVSLAPKVSVEQARVDWALPALAIDRRIRGCTPDPGAWTTWRADRIKLGPVTLDTDTDTDKPALRLGEVRAERHRVWVGTASGSVLLGQIQPTGKKPMVAADWARGVRPQPGECFE